MPTEVAAVSGMVATKHKVILGNYYSSTSEASPEPRQTQGRSEAYVREATPAARRVGVEVPPSSRACQLVRVRARVRVRVHAQLLGETLARP